MKELKIKLMERMLGAELTAHLGYEEGNDATPGQTNRRNGSGNKRLKGQDGEAQISVPRDRDGSFEPELIKKGETRIDGMDDKIIGLYAAGLTVRDIRAHLEDVYGLKVSPDLISRVSPKCIAATKRQQHSKSITPRQVGIVCRGGEMTLLQKSDWKQEAAPRSILRNLTYNVKDTYTRLMFLRKDRMRGISSTFHCHRTKFTSHQIPHKEPD